MKKKVGYPPLPKGKRGVKRKLFGGKEARRARRAERQEDRQERRTARQEARQQAKEEGVGFFGRMRAGFQAGREVREQQKLEDMAPEEMELDETAPEMTGAIGGGVDTSAAGAGMDSGGNIAAQKGGVIPMDRRMRRKLGKRKQERIARNVADGTYPAGVKKRTIKSRIEDAKRNRQRRKQRRTRRDDMYNPDRPANRKRRYQKGGAARPKYAGQKRRVPPGDMPNPDARYESTRDRRRYRITDKGLRTRKSAIRREKRKQRNSMK